MEVATFNDPAHSCFIQLEGAAKAIVDTPEFQRLRSITQLGGSYLVYSLATHSRFEHSIGTAYLAKQFVLALRDKLPNEDKSLISDRDVAAVEIAGLCHDLGHGPFSHLFENILHERGNFKWHHEHSSIAVLKHLVSNNAPVREALAKKPVFAATNEALDEFIKFVGQLIVGYRTKDSESTFATKPFLFEIVANKHNGLDVDKMDYLTRDMRNTTDIHGRPDFQRIVANICLIKDQNGVYQLRIRDKIADEIIELFSLRYKLHRDVCFHPTVGSVQAMIVDCFLAGEKLFAEKLGIPNGTSSWLANLDASAVDVLLKLDDDIFRSTVKMAPATHKAAYLYRRIEERRLYRKICSFTFIDGSKAPKSEKGFLDEFIQAAADEGIKVDEVQYKCQISRFKFGSEKESTADRFRFYDKHLKAKSASSLGLFAHQFSKLKEFYNYAVIYVYWRGEDDQTDPKQQLHDVCSSLAQRLGAILG